jgi:PAS domain S-box-containing protein
MYRALPAASSPIRYLGLAYAQHLSAASPVLRYSVAVAFFLIALLARFKLAGTLPAEGFPFLTFFPAVLLSAYLVGLGPGLLTSALSILAAWFFFIQPDRSIPLAGSDMVALAFFSAILLIDCVVIDLMKSALARLNRTEQRLRESGHRLQLVLDKLYVYVGILDLDGTLREINQEPLRVAHLERENVIGQLFWDTSWWTGDAGRQAMVRAAIQNAAAGETVRFDVEVERSARKFTLDFQVSPLRESDGKITALVASAVDVSARVNAMAAQQASRREAVNAAEAAEAERRVLDATFNAVPAGIIVVDAQGKLLRMNQANMQIWGARPFPADVNSYGEWNGWWADGSARHGQRLKGEDWGLARSLRGETCSDIVEVEPFGRAGERLVTLLSSAPVLDPSGRVVGGVVAQIDITGRTEAENALRESESRFRALAENIPQLAWMSDAQGALYWYNQRWFDYTGSTLAQMAGSWRTFYHPDQVEGVTRKFQQHIQKAEPWEDTFLLRRYDGEYRWFLSRALPVQDESGRVTRWFGTNTDITDQMATERALRDSEERLLAGEQALRDADRQKDEFLATLAHELRNPLAPIRTAAELIRLREPADKAVQRARAVIERQVLHLTRLVDDLLDVSRITSGSIQLRQETLDLGALTDHAIDSMKSTLDEAGLTLEHQSGPTATLVRGDPTRLGQCIVNLVTNAAKFTPPGGRIGVRIVREGSRVAVEVSDTGIGISAGNLERIFELFVQERPSGLHGNTGLGIGLALTRKLAALHGGTVSASSAGPGRGSTFRLELPAADAADNLPVPEAAAPTASGAGVRVLVVEDNCDAADLLAEMLQMIGFSVRVAYTGQSGLDAFEQDPPDAVLLDIGLPDLDGYEVCRRIRSLKLPSQPVVVALTGWGNDADRDRTTQVGFSAHLTKPAEPDQIVALLQELLPASRSASPQFNQPIAGDV